MWGGGQICLYICCKTLLHSQSYNINQSMSFSIQAGKERAHRRCHSHSGGLIMDNRVMKGVATKLPNGREMVADVKSVV